MTRYYDCSGIIDLNKNKSDKDHTLFDLQYQFEAYVLNNFIHTLKSFKILRKKMKSYGFTHFYGRVFNQDPVENFFCQMKQHGVKNNKPTLADFSSCYKSVLVNTIVRSNAKDSNCLNDDSSSFIVTMKNLFDKQPNALEIPWTLPDLPDNF